MWIWMDLWPFSCFQYNYQWGKNFFHIYFLLTLNDFIFCIILRMTGSVMRTLSQCWYIQFSGLVTQLDAFCGESPMICRRLSLYHILVMHCYVYSFGRKPTVIMAHLTYFIGGLATIFVQDYHFLLFMRFLVGCAHHTVSHLPFLIGKPQWFIMHASNSIFIEKNMNKTTNTYVLLFEGTLPFFGTCNFHCQ